MNKELEDKIYNVNPVFFRKKDLDMSQTCMCWGIECGDGWFKPISKFASKVLVLNETMKKYNLCFVCDQMKSKWAQFTCYWSMDALDDHKKKKLVTDDDQNNIDLLCDMMQDAVDSCTKECSNTCEICGKEGSWNNRLVTCGSWLTVKCQECAQSEQREKGEIRSFSEGFDFMSPLKKTPICIDGTNYCSVIGAYYGTLYPQYKSVFSSIENPHVVNDMAKALCLYRKDAYAIQQFKRILLERYRQNDNERECLLSTCGMKFTKAYDSMEEFFNNDADVVYDMYLYAFLLSEVRDILEQEYEN